EANGDRVTWTYDPAYQLKREQRSGANANTLTHTYDAAGNRTLKDDGGTRTTFAYDNANQLQYRQDGTGRTTFAFDGMGNQQVVTPPAGNRTTQVWDAESRLTNVLLPGGTRNTFTYNGDGSRVKQDDSAGTARLIWDGSNVLTETDAGGVTQAEVT